MFRTACIVLLLAFTNSCPLRAPGTTRSAIEVEGLRRTFLLHIPTAVKASNDKIPLVIALHPFTGTGASMERLTGFSAIADREGFLVAYPDGRQRVWNANPASPSSIIGEPANDVAFIDALIDHLIASYAIDPDRVYVTGASSGGLMTHRVAGDLTDKLAAAASVMITLPTEFPPLVTPSEPLSFLMIHGKADPFFPWEGGTVDEGPGRSTEYLSVADSLAYWIENNKASSQSVKEELPDVDPNDGTTVFREEFVANTNGAPVVFYGIRDGGHTWPGSNDIFPESLVGKTSQDINASEIVWEFFSDKVRE
ncbi:MAG: prolyl oligopeptidase family serine peptidase [Candidatus Hydrogenedentes bacterium]|nr:prolyl oligopeptidase family serine peptidase [Candidatus Hydrogenedentota bacterium]